MTVPGGPWRLFVAVPLEDGVRAALAAALDPVRRRATGGRWQDPATWHLTLRFLGDTPLDFLPGIEDAVRATGARQPPFGVALGHAGSFERRAGRVAWIGLERGDAELSGLAADLAARLVPAEFAPGPLRAHLTIARDAPEGLVPVLETALQAARRGGPAAPRVGLGSPLPSMTGDDPFAWTADRLVLYRSVLGRTGAVHTPLVEAVLGR
jgi:RNA 2',3'-cyclic 3'-phosphodiesterase